MVQNSQVSNTRQRQPGPSRLRMSCERAQESCSKHDIVRSDGGEEVRAGQSGDQGEVGEEQGGA